MTVIKPYLRLSGLEPLIVRPETNFINVGERTNVTGSKMFARLVREGQYEAALAVARQQVVRAGLPRQKHKVNLPSLHAHGRNRERRTVVVLDEEQQFP